MIVVNFSTKQHLKGQKRLKDSLVNSGVQFLGFTDYGQINSPTHQQSPYEFKLHAIEKAWEVDPVVLWADSSMWRVGDISKIQTLIENDGYFMQEAGHYVSDWCNDFTLKYFNIERTNPFMMFSAGLVGLHRDRFEAREFFRRWKASAIAGCFKGDHKDHRHDMTCGSIIAQQMQLKYQKGGEYMAYIGGGYTEPKEGVVFYAQGI